MPRLVQTHLCGTYARRVLIKPGETRRLDSGGGAAGQFLRQFAEHTGLEAPAAPQRDSSAEHKNCVLGAAGLQDYSGAGPSIWLRTTDRYVSNK